MFSYFLQEENKFQSFSQEHWFSLLFMALLFCFIIFISKKYLNESQQRNLGFGLALFTTFGLLLRTYIYYRIGSFSIIDGLPLYVCRLLTFVVPFLMWNKNKKLFGILYFLVLAGTTQALLTPDLKFGFPNFESIFYWQIHGGLVLVILYAVFVYKMKPNFRDLKNAFICCIIYLIVIHGINHLLGSNYAYTMHKPKVASILDLMGPWPIYLLTGIGVSILLFGILYLPFFKKSDFS